MSCLKKKKKKKKTVIDENVTRYLLGMSKLRCQGLIYFTTITKGSANCTYKDLQTVKFKSKLSANQ